MASTEITVKGGCHCGAIKYEFQAIPDKETGKFKGTRCNCTFCNKLSTTNYMLPNPESPAFKLLSPPSREELGDYSPRVKTMHRYFCKTCGVHVWMEGYYEYQGNKHQIFALNLASVDQPQEGIDLSEVQVDYFDMLGDQPTMKLGEKPFPGGLL